MKIIYIDAQNVHKSIENNEERQISRKKFYVYCKEKFKIDKIKIFFGYVYKFESLYKSLKECGYEVVFKETLILPNGNIKGNVDIDIAVVGLKDFYENNLSEAFLFSGDGDFNTLIDFRKEKKIFKLMIIPGVQNSSKLLRKSVKKQILDIIPLKNKLQKKSE